MTDGNIIAAKQKLSDAIKALIDPQPRTILLDGGHTKSTYIPSRWDHLVDSLGGQNVCEKSGGEARLPIWADCLDEIRKIETTVATWTRAGNTTPKRLKAINNASYRPQDTDLVTAWAATIDAWSSRIDHLLDPPSTKEVLAPCPHCGSRYHHRMSSGERVKEAALQITANGCQCLCCKATWPPSRYIFLLRLIGGNVPDGMLENDTHE